MHDPRARADRERVRVVYGEVVHHLLARDRDDRLDRAVAAVQREDAITDG